MRQFVFLLGSLLIVNLVFMTPAQATRVCVRSSVPVNNGAIKLAKSVRLQGTECPAGFTESATLSDDAVAFARVAADGSVRAFGGIGVRNVTGSSPSAGQISVTFEGTFRDLEAADSVANDQALSVFTTPKTSGFVASNAKITSATRSAITVLMSTWQVNVLTNTTEDDVSVVILR